MPSCILFRPSSSVAIRRVEPPSLLLTAIGWSILCLIIAPTISVMTFALFNSPGVAFRMAGGEIGHSWTQQQFAIQQVCTLTLLQSLLLLIAIRKGRWIGFGNFRAGVGIEPIRHVKLLVLLAIIIEIVGPLFVVLIMNILDIPIESMKSVSSRNISYTLVIFYGALVVGLAPVAEEIFFRGWLWVALRTAWSGRITGIATGSVFLAFHLGDGLYKPLYIIPAAIVLSMVRHYCRSVLASISCHVFYNLLIVLCFGVPL